VILSSFWCFPRASVRLKIGIFGFFTLRFQAKGGTPLVIPRKGIPALPANGKLLSSSLLFSLIVPFHNFLGVRCPGQVY
jgi:hypothetical protein